MLFNVLSGPVITRYLYAKRSLTKMTAGGLPDLTDNKALPALGDK